MNCPYCNGTENFISTNLSHKYLHNVKGCKKYFKVCPICSTQIISDYPSSTDVGYKVNSIFEITSCPICHQTWLPDFPTSWARSITNINKSLELAKDIFNISEISSKTLLQIQRSHNGVIYNPTRANLRGVQEYISSSPNRRMSEYILCFKFQMLLQPTTYSKNSNFDISPLGIELVTTEDLMKKLSLFILSYANIKLTNCYCPNSNSSCYKYFEIRFLYNILRIIKYISSTQKTGASQYQIAISLLCRNENEYNSFVLPYIDKYSSNAIRDIFFKDDSEVTRAVKSPFLKVFESMYLISFNKSDSTYSLTPMGIKILDFIDHCPAIWWNNISSFSFKVNTSPIKVFAKLLIWRLLKHNLIDRSLLDIKFIKDINKTVESITKNDISNIYDLHINLNYDEPNSDDKPYNQEIMAALLDMLSNKYTQEEMESIISALPLAWFDRIYSIVLNYEHIAYPIIKKALDLSVMSQSGGAWHIKSKKLLSSIGFNVIDYKDNPCFANLQIPKLSLMLPGNSLHNPDLLINSHGFGPSNCILVDAKDTNSISAEVPKLMGYSIYAKDPNVNSYAIITLRGELPFTVKNRINSALNEFDRICIIEEKALEYLTSSKHNIDDILNFIIPFDKFKHITASSVKSFENTPIHN